MADVESSNNNVKQKRNTHAVWKLTDFGMPLILIATNLKAVLDSSSMKWLIFCLSISAISTMAFLRKKKTSSKEKASRINSRSKEKKNCTKLKNTVTDVNHTYLKYYNDDILPLINDMGEKCERLSVVLDNFSNLSSEMSEKMKTLNEIDFSEIAKQLEILKNIKKRKKSKKKNRKNRKNSDV